MSSSTRWSVEISKEVADMLRIHLAKSGPRKQDLSKFVEEAVRWRLLDFAAANARPRARRTDPEALQRLIDDALTGVRSLRARPDRSGAALKRAKARTSVRRSRR